MINALLILASGVSSRFGGFPKAFCKINGDYLAQKTVNLGKSYYEHIYVVINKHIYPHYKSAIHGCKTFSIATGQGDAHSFLRAARLIKNDCKCCDTITLCWGDTLYTNSEIFRKSAKTQISSNSVGVSLCSIDKEPYAWYETEGDVIRASRFKSVDGVIPEGIHDQSIFIFKIDTICSQLEAFMRELCLNDDEDYSEISKKEMKLLDSFGFFYKKYKEHKKYESNASLSSNAWSNEESDEESNVESNDSREKKKFLSHLPSLPFLPMSYSLIEAGQSYSFNTNSELEILLERCRDV